MPEHACRGNDKIADEFGMHAQARMQREGRDSGHIDADNAGKTGVCIRKYASIGMDDQ
jgi:hypothetical protein